MARKKSSKNGVKKQATNTAKKSKKPTMKRHSDEIINMEELENRGGIIGNKTEYLNLYLRKFFEGHLYYHHIKTLSELADYIYNKKELYYSKHNGFKQMEYSSILTELSALSKSEQELLKKEKEKNSMDTEKYNSKKRKIIIA